MPLLRPAQVADVLGCSVRQVRAFAESGELEKVRLGRRSTRYSVAAIEDFIARKTVNGAPPRDAVDKASAGTGRHGSA